jgi:hypothetical protein
LGYPEEGSTVQQGEAAMCAKKTGSLEDLAVVGVDIGKDRFHLVGFDRGGQLVMPRNKAAVALANKLARTAWSVLRHGTRFDARRDMAMETI